MSGDTCLLCSDNVFLTILASLLWLFLLGWIFSGLAIIADDYLMKSLEKLAKRFQVPDNVAAATFLAFGSAVPEIMTSIVSTVSGKVDASLPAILGSGCIAYAVIPPFCVLAIQPFFMKKVDRENAKPGTDVAVFYRTRELPKSQKMRRGSQLGRARSNSLVETLRTYSGGGSATPTSGGRERAKSVLKDVTGRSLPLKLAAMPLARDIITYIIALGLTVWFINDSKMGLTESAILVALYVVYLVVLIQGKDYWGEEQVETGPESEPLVGVAEEASYTTSKTGSFAIGGERRSPPQDLEAGKKTPQDTPGEGDMQKNDTEENDTEKNDAEKNDGASSGAAAAPEQDEIAADTTNDATTDPAAETAPAQEAASEQEAEAENASQEAEAAAPEDAADSMSSTGGAGSGSGSGMLVPGSAGDGGYGALSGFGSGSGSGGPGGVEEDVEEGLLSLVLNAPFNWLFMNTIPDCDDEAEDEFTTDSKGNAVLTEKRMDDGQAMSRKEFEAKYGADAEQKWEAASAEFPWYFLTFLISITYIAVLATVTLQLVTQLCLTLGIPQSLSGVTLIALGAEVPDCIGSIAYAKLGEGPAAVSNCLNSQIINLLVGLGLPYLIHNIVNGYKMPLGKGGSTQVFIGILLAVVVAAFLVFTLGSRVLCGNKNVVLSVTSATVLLLMYVALVGSVTWWSYEIE